MSQRWAGRWSCGVSRSTSWKAARKVATPIPMSSSVATVVMIPNWITATSQLTFNGSAGRTRFRPASQHTGGTSRFSIGSCRFSRPT